jgi:peptide subunit release factor 1 (eRF1)
MPPPAWKANGAAALGLAQTLDALFLRQVRTLVLAEGFTVASGECPVESRVEPGRLEECPTCSAEMTPVGDPIDRAAQQKLEQDGQVEIVHEAAAELLRDECDGIGALLRFRLYG